MSKLSAFLHPSVTRLEKEVVISDRFRDEEGKPVPFRIRSITQEENEALSKRCRKTRRVNGQDQEHFDSAEFSRLMVVEGTLEPDFRGAELCEAYGVMDPAMVPGRMLLAGEFDALLRAISDLSGFTRVEDEVKN